jgi:hypothetical protein
MRALSPENARIVRELTSSGMDATGVVIAMERYHGVTLTYHQVGYYLRKAGIRRPRVSRGRVLA